MSAFPETEALLRRFVACRTVNGGERPLALEIAELVKSLGMKVEVQELGDDRANVYAEIGEGRNLMLCGHLDVVPAEGEWHSDPFTLTDYGDRYVARGCADMKGALAAMLTAAAKAVAKGLPPGRKLSLLFVADEEHGNTGIRRFLETHPHAADVCVIGEPTDLEVAVAHKGVARIWITLQGRAAHSSLPGQGINALVNAAKAVLALEKENERLKTLTHPVLPPRTLCVTMGKGGERENIVPESAELLVDHRLFPGDTYESAVSTVSAVLDALRRDDARFAYTLRRHCFLPGGSLPPDHPWTRAACRMTGEARNKPCAPVEFRSSCEQALMLAAGIPTVIIGPGSLNEAHTTDESLPKGQLTEAVAVYGMLIDHFTEAFGGDARCG